MSEPVCVVSILLYGNSRLLHVREISSPSMPHLSTCWAIVHSFHWLFLRTQEWGRAEAPGFIDGSMAQGDNVQYNKLCPNSYILIHSGL